jgi:hypothetical protein
MNFRNPVDWDISADRTEGFQLTIQPLDKVEVMLDVQCSYPAVCPLHQPFPPEFSFFNRNNQMKMKLNWN